MSKAHISLVGLLAVSALAAAANAHEVPARSNAASDAAQMHCVSQGGRTLCEVVIDENTGTTEW